MRCHRQADRVVMDLHRTTNVCELQPLSEQKLRKANRVHKTNNDNITELESATEKAPKDRATKL